MSETKTDDAKLAEIRARAEAATPEWYEDGILFIGVNNGIGRGGFCLNYQRTDGTWEYTDEELAANTEFAAHARQDIPWLLDMLAALQEQQAAQAAELLSLARAYDPNCDEYHYETQLAAMKAARQTVEAMQELATYLGRDPEGCLSDVPDEAMGKIEELEAELERVRGELRVANLKASHSLTNNLCSDHRDKQQGRPCLACMIESLERQLTAAREKVRKLATSGLSDEQIDQELKAAGIDMQPAFDRMKTMIDEKRQTTPTPAAQEGE